MQELQVSSGSLQAAKRKAEQALATLQEEYDELETESHENGEKLKKAVEQNSRMQSEMVADKERLRGLEKSKVGTQGNRPSCRFLFCLLFQNSLDQQVKDLSTRLNEEVANATKAAKRDAAKLQARVNLRARAQMRSLKLGHLK